MLVKKAIYAAGPLSLFFVLHANAQAAPQFRADLQRASSIFCGESSETLADAGVFDAQIELAFAKDVKDFVGFATDFAAGNQHRGFSYGTCRDQRQWLVSTPAPERVISLDRKSQMLTLKAGALQAACATYDIDTITARQTQPEIIFSRRKPTQRDEVLTLKAKSFMSASLTCHPPAKLTQGPELWAFVPLMAAEVIPKLANEKELMQWIGNQRRDEGLGSLARADELLQKVADAAAAQQNLQHPRALLLEHKIKLKSQGVQILGENRASAASFTALAELLWNSPQHRRLLLNPSANVIALNTSQMPDRSEKLLVMILARQ